MASFPVDRATAGGGCRRPGVERGTREIDSSAPQTADVRSGEVADAEPQTSAARWQEEAAAGAGGGCQAVVEGGHGEVELLGGGDVPGVVAGEVVAQLPDPVREGREGDEVQVPRSEVSTSNSALSQGSGASKSPGISDLRIRSSPESSEKLHTRMTGEQVDLMA